MNGSTSDHDNTQQRPGNVQAEPDDFEIAHTAITRAIRAINNDQRAGDGGEFITHVLATVAANLGSTDAVTRSRPGSWEAAGVSELLHSTVGSDDEYLMTYRTEPVEIVVNSTYELDDLGIYETYEASLDHIGQVLFGDRWTPARGKLTTGRAGTDRRRPRLLVRPGSPRPRRVPGAVHRDRGGTTRAAAHRGPAPLPRAR